MKYFYTTGIIFLMCWFSKDLAAQNCPVPGTSSINSNPNTYYPGIDNTISAGVKTINLGPATGSTPIATGDLLLIIQMQGAQINATNTSSYGDGVTGGSYNGYLNNSALQAGNMEYIVATNTVPLGGGSLTLLNGTVNSYKNSNFGADGQYRYQIIRVGVYYNLTLTGTITAANWNGNTGGVLVISVTNTLSFNGQRLTAAAAGFRGGAARQLPGGTGGLNSDIVTLSTQNFNGSKAEGIAGTPRFVDDHGVIVDNGITNEGYPNGSYAAGAPGNAGGGGTDGNPSKNDQNSGGGGGGNGGTGGRGGNSWSSNLATGGEPGATFGQRSAARLVMGGGGGAGTTNNGTGSFSAGFSSSGAAGGGIVLLTANTIIGNGTIDVSGESAFITVLNDGSGGGGAGGSALIYAGSGLSNITVNARGGTGGTNTGTGSPHGPGGGGGGGVVFSNDTLNPATSVVAGTAGFTAFGTTHYNALDGNTGVLSQNITKSQTPNQFLECTLLPVQFIDIRADWQNENVIIEWDLSDEIAVKSYSIEKSTDGINYNTVGLIFDAKSFVDKKVSPTSNVWYRVKETDINDHTILSNAVIVRAKKTSINNGLSILPNPVNGETASIAYQRISAEPSNIQLSMFSLSGVQVWRKSVRIVPGKNTITLTNLASIPNGLYILQITEGETSINSKLMIQH